MKYDNNAGWISQYSVACSLGSSPDEIAQNLFNPTRDYLSLDHVYSRDRQFVANVDITEEKIRQLPQGYRSRNNALVMSLVESMDSAIIECIERYGHERVGVVVGTSTTGIATSEQQLREYNRTGVLPAAYNYRHQEIASPVQLLCQHYGLGSAAYAVSTACTSGAKAMASARRLIASGVCDAVICGGVDTLCEMTANGFSALGAVSSELSLPFDEQRQGINLGEGGALFLMTRHQGRFRLRGAGECSDAHHISAPDPSGQGALTAMSTALRHANLTPELISYINLHGTGTTHNDAMEAKAVQQLFGRDVACSSTKTFTGHTLGAAGAVEAAFCLMALQHQTVPGQRRLNVYDPKLPELRLMVESEQTSVAYCMSNSFAFGGNNISLILEANSDG